MDAAEVAVVDVTGDVDVGNKLELHSFMYNIIYENNQLSTCHWTCQIRCHYRKTLGFDKSYAKSAKSHATVPASSDVISVPFCRYLPVVSDMLRL